jgi:hypothetical protein
MHGQVGEPIRHGPCLPSRITGDEDGDRGAQGIADVVHQDLPIPHNAEDQHIDLVIDVRGDPLTCGKRHKVGVQVSGAREVLADSCGKALVSASTRSTASGRRPPDSTS